MNYNVEGTFKNGFLVNMRVVFCLLLVPILVQTVKADPLPSWNEGEVKQNIIKFVQTVTDKSSPSYVAPESRIATFDNDGTLWVEKPLYPQIIFAIDRIKALAPQHPEWKTQKPFSLFLSDDKQAYSDISLDDLKKILIATHTNMTIEEFHNHAKTWLATTQNPRYHHLYTETVYQPMLEVISYLRKNDFQIYIVTGGGQEFVRSFSEKTYGIGPEHVIGTLGETKYEYLKNKPELIKIPSILHVDDGHGKPEAINYFIGRKPIIAFGNSDGDKQMLEWTQSGNETNLMLLIHHDDATREYAYGAKSKIGTFSDALMSEAIQNRWKIVSMKNDWKVIFPFEINNHKNH